MKRHFLGAFFLRCWDGFLVLFGVCNGEEVCAFGGGGRSPYWGWKHGSDEP